MTNSIKEIDGAETIFVIGANTTNAHPVIAQRMRRRSQNGAKLIVANPKEIDLVRASDYFIQHKPGSDVALLMGITAFAVFIYLTHRLAGPLYRFERSLEEVARGDLSYRIHTRKDDELKELEKGLNSLVKDFDARLGSIKSDLHRLEQIAAKGSSEGGHLKEPVQRLKDKVAHFKTTL